MRDAKDLAAYLDEKYGEEWYKEEFETDISGAIADVVVFFIDKEAASITVDLEKEEIIIEEEEGI